MSDYFATKYDSAAHEVIAMLADEAEGYGSRDDTTGNIDAPTGHIAYVSIPADVEWQQGVAPWVVDSVALEYGVTPGDVAGFHIVTSTDQGYVYVESFATEVEARAEFDCRAARFAEWDDEDSAEDGDGVYMCPVAGHGYHIL